MPPKRRRLPAASASERVRKKRVIGHYCAVPGCSNYAGKTKGMGVSYFKFPADPTLQDLWVRGIRRGGVWNPDKARICSTHFKDDDFIRDFKAELMGLKERKMLKSGVVPTQNLPDCLEEDDSQSGLVSPNEGKTSDHGIGLEKNATPLLRKWCIQRYTRRRPVSSYNTLIISPEIDVYGVEP